MELVINKSAELGGDSLPIELVERKGLGHPDSICDVLAERFCLALCRYYQDHFGQILHHNVDKVLLRGGGAAPAFGGGRSLQPIEVYLSGRATEKVRGQEIPIEELAIESARTWLKEALPELDGDRNVDIRCLVRPGSADLTQLYERAWSTGQWLANDTSIGVGFAPLSRLESVVLHIERHLNATATRVRFPMLGRDIKILGSRIGQRMKLTVAAAFIDRHLPDLRTYVAAKAAVSEYVAAIASDLAAAPVEVEVNVADDLATGSVYITASGTSAEAGDDGQTGRGNRVNGLITPYRPMTMESVAGKNPVTHVGKIYNIAAGLIADALVQELAEVLEAHCWLVSRIGQPVDDPAIVNLRLRLSERTPLAKVESAARAIVKAQMAHISEISDRLLAREIVTNGWPLGLRGAAVGPFAERRRALTVAVVEQASRTAVYTRRPEFSSAVLQAIASVPRHQFVAEHLMDVAYQDEPLPIGSSQVISQPFIVALMTDMLDLDPEDVVMEVGTGSGYQAAVLAALSRLVYSIEVIPSLAKAVGGRLRRLGYSNVVVREGNGRAGWPERTPFDAIIVTAVTESVPPALIAQLKSGGRLVMPVGKSNDVQWLCRFSKDAAGTLHQEKVLPVSFVPLVNQ